MGINKEDVLRRLDKLAFYEAELNTPLKLKGAEAQALCPFHEDKSPSLSINIDSSDWFCHAGCGGGDAYKFFEKKHGVDFKTALSALAERTGVSDNGGNGKRPVEVTAYDYVDEAGALIYQAVRFEPKAFRQRRPDGNGGWIWNLDGVRRVLYRLPEVITARSVIICEGEKDADNVRALGLISTCNAQGAGKWLAEYSESLRGKRVAILPDNDEPGRKHGALVARSLQGIAESVKVIELPGLPLKGDVSDWIAARKAEGKGAEAIRAELIAMIKAAPEWMPTEQAPDNGKAPEGLPPLRAVSCYELLETTFPPRETLLYPWLPTQGVCMLYAMRGVGKTHVAIGIAVAVAGGGEFLRWKAERPRGVLYIDGEMPGNALQERYAQTLASIELATDTPHLQIITPDLQERAIPDLSTIEGQAAIEPHLEGVSLVILDNLSTLCRSGRENETESWIPVQEWVLNLRRRGISTLFIHHAGKGGQQRGASKREDILDTVISLARPGDYNPSEGARFEVHYEKSRHIHGDETKPFEALLTVSPNMTQTWTVKDLEQSLTERVAALLREGIPQKEIAEMLRVAKGTVSKHKQRAIEQGLDIGGER